MNHPARENHRIIPLTINDSAWNLQYSPYVYYNEHCIVFNNQHTPMKIERATFRKLLDFVGLFPHYFVGSNADLPSWAAAFSATTISRAATMNSLWQRLPSRGSGSSPVLRMWMPVSCTGP